MSVGMQASFSTQIGNNEIGMHYDNGPKHVQGCKSRHVKIQLVAAGIFAILGGIGMLAASVVTGCFAFLCPLAIPAGVLGGILGIAVIGLGIGILVKGLKG
jgi:hypothetical protein